MSVINDNQLLLDIIVAAKAAKTDVPSLSYREYKEHGNYDPSTVARRFGSWEHAKASAAKTSLKDLKATLAAISADKTREERKAQLLDTYYTLLAKSKDRPSTGDLVNATGISRDAICRLFGSVADLEAQARVANPDAFKDIALSTLFSPKAVKTFDATVRKHKRFVITTAVTDCAIHEGFYAAIKNYCHRNEAALLILIASDPAHNRAAGDRALPADLRHGTVDKRLANEIIVLKDTSLCNDLFLSTLKTSAKMIDPLTGVERLAQKNGSLILASPKQRQKVVPVANARLPHVCMTTGALTLPDYNTSNYMSERLAYIADNDHQIGAIVVEVSDEMYHYRQIQADIDGSFYDIAGGVTRKYTSNTVSKANAAALVLGDWHSGETDPAALSAWADVAAACKPDHVVIHDGFNGLSINHHEQDDHITRAVRASNQQLSLSTEIAKFAQDLKVLATWGNESVVIVKSNHDEFLERYLREGRYVSDPHNHRLALQLALAMLDGLDPLQYGVDQSIGPQERIRWLTRDEDFRIARIQLGAHGDQGPNGSRGNLRTMEQAYGNSVTGHSHVPEILRGAWSVGTSSYLRLGYNDGPSSWMQTSCIVYPNGSRQLINCIGGAWRSE